MKRRTVPLGSPHGFVTIDATKNRFLDRARAQSKGLGHQSVDDVIGNVRSAIDAAITIAGRPGRHTVVNIVGHGDRGIIITGTGRVKREVDLKNQQKATYLDGANKVLWLPRLAALADGVEEIRFWGCHVGGGWEGAAFLTDVARVAGVPASGPSGFIYADPTFAREVKSRWVTASPDGGTLAPVEPPKYPREFAMTALYLKDASGDIVKVDLTRLDSLTLYRGTDTTAQPAVQETEPKYVRLMTTALAQLDRPFMLPGIPAAVATATLVIRYRYPLGNEPEEREFTVLNNLLLEDSSFPGTYYQVYRETALELLAETKNTTPDPGPGETRTAPPQTATPPKKRLNAGGGVYIDWDG